MNNSSAFANDAINESVVGTVHGPNKLSKATAQVYLYPQITQICRALRSWVIALNYEPSAMSWFTPICVLLRNLLIDRFSRFQGIQGIASYRDTE